jgi:hypothetical protein
MYFFVGNYGGPLRTAVFAADGVTPKLPLDATVTVINMDTGATVVENQECALESGSAYYSIPSGSPITATPAHLVAYMDVLVEAGNLLTNPIYFDVLDKASYRIVEKWRKKVETSAPSPELLDDENAREWIDSAVAFVGRRYGITTYTSVLGSLTPAPTANEVEFYAEVASLMARTAWWAGKGNWRDEEMSFNASPFREEWERLDRIMEAAGNANVYGAISHFNRDNVYLDGIKYDSPSYWYLPSGSVAPITSIPV